jgi:hypothetical protein
MSGNRFIDAEILKTAKQSEVRCTRLRSVGRGIKTNDEAVQKYLIDGAAKMIQPFSPDWCPPGSVLKEGRAVQ